MRERERLQSIERVSLVKGLFSCAQHSEMLETSVQSVFSSIKLVRSCVSEAGIVYPTGVTVSGCVLLLLLLYSLALIPSFALKRASLVACESISHEGSGEHEVMRAVERLILCTHNNAQYADLLWGEVFWGSQENCATRNTTFRALHTCNLCKLAIL